MKDLEVKVIELMQTIARSIVKHVKLYANLARMWFLTDLEYRINFVVNFFGELLWTAVFLIFIEVIFLQVGEIAGWGRLEVLLIFGIARFTKEVFGNLIFENLQELPTLINEGRLDSLLAKPISPRFVIAFNRVYLVRLLSNLVGLLIAGYAIRELGIVITSLMLMQIFVLMISLVAIFYGIISSFMTLAFWFGDIRHGFWIYGELTGLARLPATAFADGWRFVFSFIVPIILFGALPAAALLGRLDDILFQILPLIALLWLIISTILWKLGLKSYTSAGG